MTRGATEIAGQTAAAADSGWKAVRADLTIQYSPIELPKQAPREPNWLDSFFQWMTELLRPLGHLLVEAGPVGKWLLIGGGFALALFILWKLLAPALELKPAAAPADDETWLPDREAALALLSEADRLAAEGRFDAATHLLLLRSVGQIAAARPGLVEPSSTARELAALAALPAAARTAFATIAQRVERSLFALRPLAAEDWQAARSAYADFALQKLAAGPA